MRAVMTKKKLAEVAKLCALWKRQAETIDRREKKTGWYSDVKGRRANAITEARISEAVAPEAWWRVYIEWNCKMWRFERKRRSR